MHLCSCCNRCTTNNCDDDDDDGDGIVTVVTAKNRDWDRICDNTVGLIAD